MTTGKGGVEGFSLDLPHHMGYVVVASVGYRRTEIGYLEGGEQHLALSDGDGDNRQSVP